MTELTKIERLVIEQMNKGLYLFLAGTVEGVGMTDRISNTVKKGTVASLLSKKLITKSINKGYSYDGVKAIKYLLTEEGRKYKHRNLWDKD